MNMTVDIQEKDVHITAQVTGEIDVYTAPKLKETLYPFSEKEKISMVIDLSRVSYMDSTGLGIFVGLFKNVQAHGGTFTLIGLSDRLHRLFHITGLVNVMNIKRGDEGE